MTDHDAAKAEEIARGRVLNSRDVRLEGVNGGGVGDHAAWYRAVHFPTGVVVETEPSEHLTRAELEERLGHAVARALAAKEG